MSELTGCIWAATATHTCSYTCSWHTCCSVLQCVAVWCNISQCVAVWQVCCSVLQCVAVTERGECILRHTWACRRNRSISASLIFDSFAASNFKISASCLKCVAVCYSVKQSVAAFNFKISPWCLKCRIMPNVSQVLVSHIYPGNEGASLQHTATRSNTRQHAATHYNTTLQHAATYCNTLHLVYLVLSFALSFLTRSVLPRALSFSRLLCRSVRTWRVATQLS